MITYNPYNWKIKKATDKNILCCGKCQENDEMTKLLLRYKKLWDILIDIEDLINKTENDIDRQRMMVKYFFIDGRMNFILKQIRNLYI